MTPYPHPTASLNLFQTRLSLDMAQVTTPYTLTCSAPLPTATALQGQLCAAAWSAKYNSQVDLSATGALEGVVHGYLYNRIDIGAITLPPAFYQPYLAGSALTVQDLLPQLNARSGLNLQPEDVLATPLPSTGLDCDPEGVSLIIAPTSLLFIGQVTIYVVTQPYPLNRAITQPFINTLGLPALTP